MTRRLASLLTAIACFVGQLAVPPAANASHLGSSTVSAGSVPPPSVTTAQSFQPDLFTGRAATSVPLLVPPGRRGVQPQLALAYSSSGRNSWVGVGWDLDVGYIERSTKEGAPTYEASDAFTFMLQGTSSELVKTSDGTYRAKDEGLFLHFRFLGAAGWEVKDKSGTRYLFGQDARSQLEDAGRVFRWCLDKVLDVHGNSLSISYTKHDGYPYLTQIRYTAHEPTGLAPANQVDFLLEDRADAEVSHRSGFSVRMAKRLKAVETRATVDGALALAGRYELTYTQSTRTGRCLLSAVTRVGADGTTRLPPTTFTYGGADQPTYSLTSNIISSSAAAWNVRIANISLGHDNWGPASPYDGRLPWQSPQVLTGPTSAAFGCVNITVNADGSLGLSGCQDHYVHAWTWLYVSAPTTLSLNLSRGSCDSNASLWQEDVGGLRQVSPGNVLLEAGWTMLHLTEYHEHDCFTSQLSGSIKSMVETMSATSQFTEPQLAGDVDGNGTTDLVTFEPVSGTWKVSCARSCSLLPTQTWLTGFGGTADMPLVGDWDGDGKTDIATYRVINNQGSWQFAVSTGSGFQLASGMTTAEGSPLIGDFNGDGRADLGTYQSGVWRIALAQKAYPGTTWFATTPSFDLTWGGGASPLTGDFNGDGLTDIATVSGGTVSVAFSTGTAFLPQAAAWITGFGSGNHTTADFNGDGLTDVAFCDRTNGRFMYAPATVGRFGTSVTLPVTFSLRTASDQPQVGDFNGDGLADPALFNAVNGSSEITLSNGEPPDLLTVIRNGVGGTTTITYQRSTETTDSAIPFVLPLVSRVTADDGSALTPGVKAEGHQYTTTYAYAGGRYDGAERAFRGFAKVEARDAAGTATITEFHQDPILNGRPFRVEVRDANGALWTKQEHDWRWATPQHWESYFAFIARTDAYTYDGNDSFKQTATTFAYYEPTTGEYKFGWFDDFGNPTQINELGDVSVTGDERHTFNDYTINEDAWIVDRLAHTKVISSMEARIPGGGRTAHEKWFYYDGRLPLDQALPDIDLTPPTTGQLTAEVQYWNTIDLRDPNPISRMTYDAYGNIATVTDDLGRTTTNTYDATGTYLIQVTNPLGHTRRMTSDPRFGVVTSSTDANNVTTTTQYDALGRVTKAIGPTDSATLPTMRYEYDLTTVPSRVTVHARVQSGQATELTTHTFTDGLGRTIQTRAPAEDPMKQVVTGAVEFDSLGRVVKQWVPYVDDATDAFRPQSQVSSLMSHVSYTYDPLGRLLTTTDPDGSVTAASYDDWTVTSTDANGHQTRRTSDAYGRTVTVEEFNDSEVYTTRYEYGRFAYPDSNVYHLTKVIDVAGNETVLNYDTLGRKVSMDDPDMGHWGYKYDSVGNLISQTDARGVTTTFTYDALNRLTRKEYTIPQTSDLRPQTSVTYTYDNPGKPFSTGKLTEITDGSGSSSFEYDTLGRLITETKVIDGTPYTVHRAYDLLGRLVTLTYPDGDVATYTYNAQGGLETITLHTADSTQHTDIVKDVAYNAAGQITKLAYGNGVTTDYSYDPQTLRLSALSTQHTATSTILQDFRYAFDPVGNVTQITDAVHTGTQSFQYDDLNRLTQAVGAYGTQTYAYDPIGNMTSKEGAVMTYGEGAAGPHAVTSVSGLMSQVSGLSLSYDANGNLTRKADTATGATAATLTYDADNRLTQVTTGSTAPQTVTVNLSAGWNFFSLPIVPSDLTIAGIFGSQLSVLKQVSRFEAFGQRWEHYVKNPAFNQFDTLEPGRGYALYLTSPVTLTLTGVEPSSSQNLTAGRHVIGNPTSLPRTLAQVLNNLRLGVEVTGAWRYTGGGFVALSQADTVGVGEALLVELPLAASWVLPQASSQTTRFLYDGDGGRVKLVGPQGTTTFLGSSYEVAPDGSTTKYVFAGSQRVAAVVSSLQSQVSSLRYYHGDHLGSSNVITDGSGTLVELAEYTPYGSFSRTERADGPTGERADAFGFTGQRLDATGLYFYQARYYDPNLGRFLSADPVVPSPGDPQALNRYSYVRNNPLKYVDPSGHGWFSKFFSSILQAVGILAAPFTGGASLWLTAAGTVWSGVQAAQAGQFGAWAAGFGASLVTAGLASAYLAPAMAGFLGAGTSLTAAQGAIITATEFGLAGAAGGFTSSLVAGGSLGEAGRAAGLGFATGAGIGGAIGYTYAAGMQDVLHGFDTRGYNSALSDYQTAYGQLNPAERVFVRRHPIASYKLLQSANNSLAFAQRRALTGSIRGGLAGLHNGDADAVRHALWGISGTRAVGRNLTTEFTSLHEFYSNNPPLEIRMDLFNNHVGITLGVDQSKRSFTSEYLAMEAYRGGELQTSLYGN